ncbi:cobalamin biosynthesis protein CbiM [bacterium]|nr:cobalamin biosynthesis protein CbiM [bacterium]PIU91137.1 MAG: cobalamin biosynthesis protein CbiM [Anaerolineae bacterium CG06_land_8_20_14_3_00_57_67]PIW20820.1 MAG: cobalamin biosynthesis protein CbiM [Anaerolineae bacterium CG17_big_fil_post_rev_8_21_14_2_50_57_27]PIX47467.1 MAG: cobalamin biosynthesis protein CbiM [Anaerolineae bacterium CG_4_8_14_3_um_filter_59_70]
MLYSPVPMHIPDGFLSTLVAVVLWVVSAIAVAYALRRVGKDLGERQVPLMGVLAAAIFAGQMLNFSVTGGTSGHLVGAALATILLGPWAAVIVLTSVVSIQALIFQDGGLLALGANLFNMALVGVTVSYFVYTSLQKLARGRSWGIFAGGFAAAWLSVVVASLACALELAISGTSPANISVPAMGGIHMLIGIGEGLITVGALAFLYAARRDLFRVGEATPKGGAAVWTFGLGIAILLAVLSPLASAHPDGLEWVAEQKGFLDIARGPLYEIIPDYTFPGISNTALATIVAGILGTLLVFGVALAVAFIRRKRPTT